MLDQCSIVLYLNKKGLSREDRDNNLVATIGPDTRAYCAAPAYIHDAKRTRPKVISPPDMISRQFDESDQAILLALEEQPFSSGWQLSRVTNLSCMTIYCRQTGSLNSRVRHL
jgi:hypothetical protein